MDSKEIIIQAKIDLINEKGEQFPKSQCLQGNLWEILSEKNLPKRSVPNLLKR